MPRPTNTTERRQQIVAALKHEMARHGYAGASIARVARAAGLAPGVLHYHFASKEEMLLALLAHLEGMVAQRRAARDRGARSARGRLEAYLDAHLATGPDADAEGVACWVALGTEALREPRVGQAYEAAVRRQVADVTALLGAAWREAGRPGRGIAEAASGIVALVEGCYRLAAAAPGIIPPGSAAATARRMVHGLLPDVPARRSA